MVLSISLWVLCKSARFSSWKETTGVFSNPGTQLSHEDKLLAFKTQRLPGVKKVSNKKKPLTAQKWRGRGGSGAGSCPEASRPRLPLKVTMKLMRVVQGISRLFSLSCNRHISITWPHGQWYLVNTQLECGTGRVGSTVTTITVTHRHTQTHTHTRTCMDTSEPVRQTNKATKDLKGNVPCHSLLFLCLHFQRQIYFYMFWVLQIMCKNHSMLEN